MERTVCCHSLCSEYCGSGLGSTSAAPIVIAFITSSLSVCTSLMRTTGSPSHARTSAAPASSPSSTCRASASTTSKADVSAPSLVTASATVAHASTV